MEKIRDTILKFLKLDNLIEHASGFIENRIALLKFELREEVASVLSRSLIYGFALVFGLLLLFFTSFGLANYLNDVLQSRYVGYWIVAGIYFLLTLILFILRRPIEKSFEKHFMDLIARGKSTDNETD